MAQTVHVVCPRCDTTNRVPRERLDGGGKCGACGNPLFARQPLVLNGSRFAKHAQASDVPLLIDFWAAWCVPCRVMAPVFERAAAELEPQVRLAKVDTETAPELAERYNIRSIPSLVLV